MVIDKLGLGRGRGVDLSLPENRTRQTGSSSDQESRDRVEQESAARVSLTSLGDLGDAEIAERMRIDEIKRLVQEGRYFEERSTEQVAQAFERNIGGEVTISQWLESRSSQLE